MSRFINCILKMAMVRVYSHEQTLIQAYNSQINTEGGCMAYLRTELGELIEEEMELNGRQLQDDLEFTVLSNCTHFHFLKVKSLSPSLPRLVPFINAFIHASASYYCLRYFRLSSQFW
mmetsp:Transcript_11515/g.19479  ORF Transcript_11515/g.19479 Transcript_11515/m.19479 type:complete len:118 (-) Transcript_11515:59-412(-)